MSSSSFVPLGPAFFSALVCWRVAWSTSDLVGLKL